MKTIAMIVVAGSLAAISVPASAAENAPAVPAHAAYTVNAIASYGDPPPRAPAYGRRAHAGDRARERSRADSRDDRYDDRYEQRRYRDDHSYYRTHDRTYDRRGRYYEPRRMQRGDRIWRGNDGRYYCERGNGTTGLVIGAGIGALLGRTIDSRGDRTVGTVLGGALGAVIGREVDRGDIRCR